MFFNFLNLLIIASNKKVLLCDNCIYFQKTSKINICKKFGELDDITKKIIYQQPENCREDVFKCGSNGFYYKDHDRLEE